MSEKNPEAADGASQTMFTRREALRIGVLATGGLVLLPWRANPSDAAVGAISDTAPSSRLRPNVFVEIGTDGLVWATVPRPEMGQGVRTASALLVADELGASIDHVRLRQADFDPAYGDQYVGGSSSMPGSWVPLRTAGAAARELLIQAAASRWAVPVTECDARDGAIIHAATARRIPFGAIVREAARLTPPKAPVLRAAGSHVLIGSRQRGLDVPLIVRGTIRFGLDARVPGMLVASIERAPAFGATTATVDQRAARASAGVKAVVMIDPTGFPEFPENESKPAPGVAVIADTTWHAMRGRQALRVTWTDGSSDDSDTLRADWTRRAVEPPHFVERSDGDFDATFAAAATRLEAVYEVPFLAHATMEPMNCLADVRKDRCELWVPTQNPEGARDIAALVSGLPRSAVHVHPMRMGGGFGRRFYSDFVAEAVHLSQRAHAPVQVVWSREDDIHHCQFRPAGIHRLQAGLTSAGAVTAWSHHLVNASRGSYLRWKPEGRGELHPGEVDTRDFPANFVPNFRLGYTEMPSAVPRGQWRAVEDSANAFVIQGFFDEVAAAAHRDPMDLQLELLARDVGPAGRRRMYDAARLRAVYELVADRAGWRGRSTRAGLGAGFAGSFSHGSYVAEVAEVERAPNGTARVRRMVVAVDCGTPVNRLGIEAQVRGAIVYGLSAALHQHVTVRAGRVQQTNFADYPPLRITEMPEIEVHIVDSREPPSGMGEGALSPAAPAVTNALFALDGRRVRRLPLEPPAGSGG